MEQPNCIDTLPCPLRHALEVIGGKWKLPIICLLSGEKPLRYNVVKRKLGGITNMMLSQSLKELEAAGIVHRVQYNEVPPRVEYSLTAQGRQLLPALDALSRWGAAITGCEGDFKPHCEACQAAG